MFIFCVLPICRLSTFSWSHYLLVPLFFFFSCALPSFLFSVLFGFVRDGSAPMSTIVTFNNISLGRFLILEPVARVFIYTSDGGGQTSDALCSNQWAHYGRCQKLIFEENNFRSPFFSFFFYNFFFFFSICFWKAKLPWNLLWCLADPRFIHYSLFNFTNHFCFAHLPILYQGFLHLFK